LVVFYRVLKRRFCVPLDHDTDALLGTWEETYKRGLLTFWLLLVLHERPTYPYEMNAAIRELSGDTISANDNSIYRALTRFEALGLVASITKDSPSGPARKYYSLTHAGLRLLATFIERNMLILQAPATTQRMQAVIESAHNKLDL
jgi:PadR family transcriptional regulator PadR